MGWLLCLSAAGGWGMGWDGIGGRWLCKSVYLGVLLLDERTAVAGRGGCFRGLNHRVGCGVV